MKKTISKIFIHHHKDTLCLSIQFISILLIIFLSTGIGYAFSTSLNEVDSESLGTRIPLILIHGTHGKVEGPAYWQNFRNYFNSKNNLGAKYKLYEFQYDSDEVPVAMIGLYLGLEIATKSDLTYKKVVILAHSMGGLVARSYIQECGGLYKVIKLITLATPIMGLLPQIILMPWSHFI